MNKKIINAIFGIVLDLFIGLLLIGTLVRVAFSLLFSWGDSAPSLGIWTEAVKIIGLTILTTYYTTRWSMGNNHKSE
jgi:hypothetical protein